MADDTSRGVPVPMDSSGLPVPLDRGAVERVLARAAQLNAGLVEPAHEMSENQLIDLGREVGITPDQMRQAIAEERTRVAVPEARGLVGEVFGGTVAVASRIVNGKPAALLADLDAWMQREEALYPKRRFTERLTWESKRGLIGNLQVNLNLAGRPYALRSADEVGATAVGVDETRSLVRLDASLGNARRTSVRLAGGVFATTLASAAGLVAVATAFTATPIVLVAGIAAAWTGGGGALSYAVGRAQLGRLTRAQLALEQILDRLEHRHTRPGGNLGGNNPIADLISTIATQVTSARDGRGSARR
jgi:hypothetical protein